MHKLLEKFILNSNCEIEKLLKNEIAVFDKTGGFTSAGASNLHLLLENREHAKELLEEEMEEAEKESPHSHAYDEIKGAEEYCRMWIETGDGAYKAMALDEIRHAEILIGQISDPAVKRNLERKREAVSVKLNSGRQI